MPQNQDNGYRPRRKKKLVSEWLILVALLVPLGLGGLYLASQSLLQSPTQAALTSPTTTETAAGKAEAAPALPNATQAAGPAFTYDEEGYPVGYDKSGKVGEYTVAVNPETGEMVIHDTNGTVGSNNTSVEGNQRELAEAMVQLDEYAEENRNKISKEEYDWMKKTAQKGMDLAYGAPDRSADEQIAYKKDRLGEFVQHTGAPPRSVQKNGEYLKLEGLLAKTDNAYQSSVNPQIQPLGTYNFLSPTMTLTSTSTGGYNTGTAGTSTYTSQPQGQLTVNEYINTTLRLDPQTSSTSSTTTVSTYPTTSLTTSSTLVSPTSYPAPVTTTSSGTSSP